MERFGYLKWLNSSARKLEEENNVLSHTWAQKRLFMRGHIEDYPITEKIQYK